MLNLTEASSLSRIHSHSRKVRGWALGRQTLHPSTAGRCCLPRLTSKEDGRGWGHARPARASLL